MSYILLSPLSLVGFVYIPLILAGVMLLEQHLETFLNPSSRSHYTLN